MFDLINITKAISDKNRIRIILALRASPMCVEQLTSLLELAPSTTSKHIQILSGAKLIHSVRKGKWVFYKLSDKKANPLIDEVLSLLEKGGEKSSTIKEDTKKAKKILSAYCGKHHEIHNF